VRFLAEWLLTGCAVVAIMIVVVVRPVLAAQAWFCVRTSHGVTWHPVFAIRNWWLEGLEERSCANVRL
jgi:hypothetical protein